MHRRFRRHVRIEQLGETKDTGRARVALILLIPVLSLVLPAVAVVVADAGGNSAPVRISADIQRFLLFYSGVFALVALTAAVGAGLLATDRILVSPRLRILAQGLHRMTSLVAVSALANHIMLEIVAHRVSVADGFVPFMASRRTFFMGLGTLASDLIVVIILTGILRARFVRRSRRWLWRALHALAYAAWPLAILHSLLAGRSAKPYVDWSYGGCLALVGLALTLRVVMQSRGRNSPADMPDPAASPFPLPQHAAGVFARLTDGSFMETARPALPAGPSARAAWPDRQAPPGWSPPEYEADWADWLAAGQPDGRER